MKRTMIVLLVASAAVAAAATNEINDFPAITPAKIGRGRDAEQVIIRKIVKDPNDGLSAAHRLNTKLQFVLGFDVPDFGKRGDRVWQVHFLDLAGQTARIAWVNAETGNVMFPMEKEKTTPNKVSDATSEPAPGGASSVHQD